jgi:hypothetical protein
LEDSSKIAAFDFDGCLANTSVKKYVYIWSHSVVIINAIAIALGVINWSIKAFWCGHVVLPLTRP